MVKTVLLLMYCYSYLGCDVCGQRACNKDSNVLDSCDGRVVSNNNINVDFDVIKYQCSCSFTFASNDTLFYSLSKNPGFNNCGTAIQIREMNDNIYSIPCTSSEPSTVVSSQFTTVELTCNTYIDSSCKDTGYCLLVFSNNASIKVHGYCQTIPPPSYSSETTITSTQSVPTNSTRSVPTHLTQSVTTNSITTPKEYLFFLAGAGGIVLVIALAVMMIVKRKNNKKSLSKKKVTENIYHVRSDERHGELNQTSVEQSAVKADTGGSQYDQSDENRGSGYWMVENSFYLSADNVVTDNEDGIQNDLDINPSVYSEINDSGNNVNHKNTFECHYDYAKVTGSK